LGTERTKDLSSKCGLKTPLSSFTVAADWPRVSQLARSSEADLGISGGGGGGGGAGGGVRSLSTYCTLLEAG